MTFLQSKKNKYLKLFKFILVLKVNKKSTTSCNLVSKHQPSTTN